jgi:hypothetical protein
MKAYGGVDVSIHFFYLGTSRRWDISGRFTPGEKAPDTHWIGGWVDPRARLNDMEK